MDRSVVPRQTRPQLPHSGARRQSDEGPLGVTARTPRAMEVFPKPFFFFFVSPAHMQM